MNEQPITATEVLASREAWPDSPAAKALYTGFDAIAETCLGPLIQHTRLVEQHYSRMQGIAERRDRVLAYAYGRLLTHKARDTFMAGVDRSYRMRG